MADPELEELRKQRLAQMQSQFKVGGIVCRKTFLHSKIVSGSQ